MADVDVAVLVRSPGEAGLQGLRTAVSLSLGDRRPGLYLTGAGSDVLAAAPASEPAECLEALAAAAVPIVVDGRDVDHGAFLAALRAAPFQQVF